MHATSGMKFGADPILAFNDPWHDSSFFFANGDEAVHVEAERFSRRKYESINPVVFFCELFPERLTSFHDVVFQMNEDHLSNFMSSFVAMKERGNCSTLLSQLPLNDDAAMSDVERRRSSSDSVQAFLTHLAQDDVQIYFSGHHASHAANAFFSSNFDEAIVVTLDGAGMDFDGAAAKKNIVTDKEFMANGVKMRVLYGSVYVGDNNQLELIQQIADFSIGTMWHRARRLLGLKDGDEGTAMAMAAFGNGKRFASHFNSPCAAYPQDFTLDAARRREVSRWYADLRLRIQTEQDCFDFSAALQLETENKIRRFIALHIGNHTNLCVAGGVFLNCQLMGKLMEWFPRLKNVYVPPAPYDGGLPIGAAQLLHHEGFGRLDKLAQNGRAPYAMGRSYIHADIRTAAAATGVALRGASGDEFLELLDQGKIIGLFQGPAESGRRALGNRSIVAHPGLSGLKDRLNRLIKHRQWFRPFAPMVLEEHVSEWFSCKASFESPYMSFALPVRPEVRHRIENVVHADGTARVQTVHRALSPEMHALLTRWLLRTGLPILLNTSFNDREPIVETPLDALMTLKRSSIDCVYFADCQLLAWNDVKS